MDVASEMLGTHPQKPTTALGSVSDCLKACLECEQACTICADACLGEQAVSNLRQCIRLDLDCADLCAATARLVARQATPDAQLWRLTLEACAQACRACAAECGRHEARMAHCRVCRETCERCEKACVSLLMAYPAGGTAAAH
jgi:hypothetical protein